MGIPGFSHQEQLDPFEASGDEVRTVRLTLYRDHVAAIEPLVPELLDGLTSRRSWFVPGGPTGVCREIAPHATWTHDRRGRLVFQAGLVPRACALLEGLGYTIEVDDRRRTSPRFRADPGFVAGLSDEARELVDAIDRVYQGQIEVRGDRDAYQKTLLVCRAFPWARLAVGVATRKDAYAFWRRLERDLGGRVSLGAADVLRSGGRVLVATFRGLPIASRDYYDGLIVPYGHEACGERAQDDLAGVRATRVFALVDPGRVTDPFTREVLETVAGPVILPLRSSSRTVLHVVLPVPPGRVPGGLSALERKRALLWNNPARNAKIAAVARAIAGRDPIALDRLGFPPAIVENLGGEGAAPRIAVLVESTEHARQLQLRLPAWPVMDAILRTRSARVGLIHPAKESTMCRLVTLTRAVRDGVLADIVIRATGRDGPIDSKALFAEHGHEQPAILVDLVDMAQTRDTGDLSRHHREHMAHRPPARPEGPVPRT